MTGNKVATKFIFDQLYVLNNYLNIFDYGASFFLFNEKEY